jgi:hypothetical protein
MDQMKKPMGEGAHGSFTADEMLLLKLRQRKTVFADGPKSCRGHANTNPTVFIGEEYSLPANIGNPPSSGGVLGVRDVVAVSRFSAC